MVGLVVWACGYGMRAIVYVHFTFIHVFALDQIPSIKLEDSNQVSSIKSEDFDQVTSIKLEDFNQVG